VSPGPSNRALPVAAGSGLHFWAVAAYDVGSIEPGGKTEQEPGN
jgi:hypothetical protein